MKNKLKHDSVLLELFCPFFYKLLPESFLFRIGSCYFSKTAPELVLYQVINRNNTNRTKLLQGQWKS